MTAPIPAPEPADDQAISDTAVEVVDDAADVPQTIEQARKLRAENKSLRTRLHTLETDYEAAITRLAAAQHAEVERIAGEILVDASDVWRAQPDMTAFYDDQFKTITADKVVEAAKKLAAEKPHLARPKNAPPPTDRPIEGLRRGASPDVKPTQPTWQDVIRGGHGG